MWCSVKSGCIKEASPLWEDESKCHQACNEICRWVTQRTYNWHWLHCARYCTTLSRKNGRTFMVTLRNKCLLRFKVISNSNINWITNMIIWSSSPMMYNFSYATKLPHVLGKLWYWWSTKHAKQALIAQMRRAFRNWKYWLREHYEKFESDDEALRKCPYKLSHDECDLVLTGSTVKESKFYVNCINYSVNCSN